MVLIAGMPGIGGSLGECQVCGRPFVMEVLTGERVMVGRVDGMDCDVAVHQKCADGLGGKPWTDLPDGLIRRAFEADNAKHCEQSE